MVTWEKRKEKGTKRRKEGTEKRSQKLGEKGREK